MGFRQAGVLSAVCFFFGVLFICFNVDYRILHVPVTEQAKRDAIQFYTLFYNAPPAIKAFLHSMMGIGTLSLLGKLHKWDESALWFDGSSLAAYVFAICVYLAVIVPNLENVIKPVEGHEFTPDESLNLVGAGNGIVMVLLALVLALQAGQVYANRVDAANIAAADAAKAKAAKSE